ncbi:MAG: GTP-binding protein [Promethearchaeota archaeon]|nr:MAG: GTP-binding protein [Candidatus Lokiarchaeota archaeon]
MEEITKKIPIHIGLFGHIDSGKTAIAEVLSEIISTAGIDAHPQSKERGITIDLGFTSFMIGNYIITLVDGPGHADLIKISASSVEIIDIALLVIDINKGPQVQTGEHIIMMEALGVKNLVVVLNKIDLFEGNLENEIIKTRTFFSSTSFGSNIPVFPVSAKKKIGFDELRLGLLNTIKELNIERESIGSLILPIDHHFSIKGRGAIITGTIIRGTLRLNQNLFISPINEMGRVKSIQIFHQDVSIAKAGDRVGVNVRGVDVKKIYRGCYATDDNNLFEYCDLIEVSVEKSKLFKPEIHFGSQIHITVGMFTTAAFIYPFEEINGKNLQLVSIKEKKNFKAYLWLNEKILFGKEKSFILLSRLDLPPTTLRIIGGAELNSILKVPPKLYKYKYKKGHIQNPNHSQGIVCNGLAHSLIGAKKIIGKKLEPPFSAILDTFGTKGSVIIGIDRAKQKTELEKGDTVILKELRSFILKSKKDLNVQN